MHTHSVNGLQALPHPVSSSPSPRPIAQLPLYLLLLESFLQSLSNQCHFGDHCSVIDMNVHTSYIEEVGRMNRGLLISTLNALSSRI